MSPAATADAAAAKQAFEHGPRRALLWGGGILVLGLALVGVGASDEGAVVALTGLLVTIYGIHSFGRLGPDEAGEEAVAEGGGPSRRAAVDAMWGGGLALVAGLAVTVGSYFASSSTGASGRYFLAYGAILGGGLRMVKGYGALQQAKRDERKRAGVKRVEADGEEAPRARRKRARRRAEG